MHSCIVLIYKIYEWLRYLDKKYNRLISSQYHCMFKVISK